MTEVAHNFPVLPSDYVSRKHLVEAIQRVFETGTDIVIVEGQDGIGKTLLLAEFATTYCDRVLSLFIRPTSPLSYDPDYLRMDLCNQLHWLLYGKEIDDPEKIPSLFGKYAFEMGKLARLTKHPYYLVIDGLDEIPDGDPALFERILGLLPLNSKMHLLIGGETSILPSERWKGAKLKSYPIPGFGPDETRRFLSDTLHEEESVRELYNVCKGIPGYLASTKRSLQNGVSLDDLLALMPRKQPDLFQVEWRRVVNEVQTQSLAIITFGRRTYTTEIIAALLDVPEQTIQKELASLSFLHVNEQSEVMFTSETFRRFAQSQLEGLKDTVAQLVIKRLQDNPDSDEALFNLPDFLQDAGKLEALLEYLSPSTFIEMLGRSQSLSMIRRKADQGIAAAEKLHRTGDLVRFGTQKSTLIEIDQAEVWRSEIDARMALQDYDAALALAQSAVVEGHRLQLLSLIAKEKARQALGVDRDLVDQIRHLCGSVDKIALGEKAVDIASDLLYVSPELAINLVESSATSTKSAGRLDWAFAQLSLITMGNEDKQPMSPDIGDSIRARIKDPAAQRFTSAAALLFGGYPAETIIREAEERVEGEEGIFLIRQWTRENRDTDGAADVIDYALKLAIKTSVYTPKARDFRELATPLPGIADTERLQDLVGQFDSQMVSLKRNGPSEEYVRLQILLAVAEKKYDHGAASERLLNIYCEIASLPDVATRTECLCWLMLALPEFDPNRELESILGLHTAVDEDFASGFETLLASSADHLRTVRGILRSMAPSRGSAAIGLCSRLNTELRRDLAFLEIVSAALEAPADKLVFDVLETAIGKISDPEIRDESILRVIERCCQEQKSIESLFPRCLRFLQRAAELRDPAQRSLACSKSYCLLARCSGAHDGLRADLLSQIEPSWASIDLGWYKVDIGFLIVRALVEADEDMAKQYMARISDAREYLKIDSEAIANSYIGCCRLAIRAYAGLVPGSLDREQDMESLTRLINSIPSNGERSLLWAELALRCFTAGRSDKCRDIVSKHAVPSYEAISDRDVFYKEDVLVKLSPALFCYHSDTALERLTNLPQAKRDDALIGIAAFILQKHPSTDPYDSSLDRGYFIGYNDAVDLCKVTEKVVRDACVYYVLEATARSTASRWGRKEFTGEQVASLSKRFEDVIASSLPDLSNIQHEGYVILAAAQIAKIRRNSNHDTWKDLLERSRQIPNLADRAFVMSMVAGMMDHDLRKLYEPALTDAKQLVDSMPDILDRPERYEDLTSQALKLGLYPLAQECTRTALLSSSGKDDPDVFAMQRRLVDLAYKISPSFASSIAEMLDTDKARASARRNARERLNVNKLREKIVSGETVADEDAVTNAEDYAHAAWMLLGSLNSGMTMPQDFAYTRRYVKIASKLPISRSYPILSWIVQNAVVMYSNKQEAVNLLRPLFDAMVTGASLAIALASRSMHQQRVLQKRSGGTHNEDSCILIHRDERPKALSFLSDWFRSEVSDELIICDPYFAPTDLEALQLLWSVKPGCKVRLLTSPEGLSRVEKPYETAFRDHWRLQLAGTSTPKAIVVVAGIGPQGKAPIHDRFWLSNENGLESGTSYNAWGGDKVTSLRTMTSSESASKTDEVLSYLLMEETERGGKRIEYSVFNL